MNSLRLKIVVLILTFSTVQFACTGNAGNTNNARATNDDRGNNSTPVGNTPAPAAKAAYPQQVADEFLKSCEEAGSEASFCKCVFDKIQGKYTFEEFSVIESKMSAGKTPDEFVEFTGKARAECTK